MDGITQTALVPWFGSNRTLAANVGAALTGCRWVGVPFAGGMCELLHIKASTVVVGDLHAHVLNLAAVVANAELRPQLVARLADIPHHPDALRAAQDRCTEREAAAGGDWFGGERTFTPDLEWALDYFVSAWQSRSASAGTEREFMAPHSVRWDAGGGDSATRFRNAASGLDAWSETMRRCNFVRLDALKFLAEVKDETGHGIYCDPPFPEVGDKYKFAFDTDDQKRLAKKLATFKRCRVVVRFYDHPLIRELYPEAKWKWHHFEGKKQTNEVASEEVLLTRNDPNEKT
jgi:hypothetical protein